MNNKLTGPLLLVAVLCGSHLFGQTLAHQEAPSSRDVAAVDKPQTPEPRPVADPSEEVLESVELTDIPFREAIGRLRDQTGANLFVSWNVLARAGVKPETPVDVKLENVTLGRVLDLILGDVAGGDGRLVWAVEEGVVRVSTFHDLERGAFLRKERRAWAEEMRVLAQLEQRLSTVTFDRTPLWQAIDSIARNAGVQIVVHWKALEAAGVGQSAPVTLTMADPLVSGALRAVLDSVSGDGTRLGYAVRNGVVEVATHEDLRRFSDTRVYDVGDLLRAPREAGAADAREGAGDHAKVRGDADGAPVKPPVFHAAKQVEQWIQATVDPDSWRDNGGAVGAVRVMEGRFAGLLVIRQTVENHREIARLLSDVRGFLSDDPVDETGQGTPSAAPGGE